MIAVNSVLSDSKELENNPIIRLTEYINCVLGNAEPLVVFPPLSSMLWPLHRLS